MRGGKKVIENLPFIAVVVLLGIGLFALLFKRNLIKIAMGIVIIGSAVNLFLISLGYRSEGIAPIFTNAPAESSEVVSRMVLPAPQALTLTSIVISLAVIALMLSLAVLFFKHTGSLNSRKMGEEND